MKKYSVLAFLVGIFIFVPITHGAAVPFSASATGQNSVSLSWTTDTYVVSQEIFYSTNPLNDSNYSSGQSYGSMPMSIPNASQSVSVSGLNSGTTYYFAYRFFDNVGSSFISYASTQTQQAQTNNNGTTNSPLSVSNFVVTSGSNYADLGWDTPTSVVLSQIEIRYGTSQLSSANFSSGIKVDSTPLPISGTHQSVRVDGLNSGTTYYFGIRTVSVVSETSPIIFSSVKIGGGSNGGGGGETPPPAPVTNLVATRDSGTNVTLSWDTPVSTVLSRFEVAYSLNQITNTTFNFSTQFVDLPLPVIGTKQSVTIPNIARNSIYYFAVRTTSVVGETSPIATASVSADSNGGGGGTSSPLAVTNLTATPGLTFIDLSWTTPQSNVLSKFDVRCSTSQLTDSNFTAATINPSASLPIPGTKQGVRADGLSSGKTYYCGVRTISIVGELSPIAYVSGTTTTGGGGGGGGSSSGGGGSSYGGGSSTAISSTSIIINDGAEKTDKTLVMLSLSAVNATEMMLSNTLDFTDAKWETYTARTQWVLLSGNGGKTVYAKFRNGSMTSSPVSDSIILEIPVPQIIVVPQYEYAPVDTSRPYTSIISISPDVTLVPGEGKVVAVLTAHSGASTKYGAHLEMDYPTDELEFDKIEYGDGWVPEFNPVYNFDNQKDGRLIKTASHQGFDQPIHFATVTFRIKKTGVGILDTNSFTLLRDLPEYKTGFYKTQADVSTISSNIGKTRLMLASLVSLTTQDNTIAVISAFVFFFLCYVAYVISMHRSGKRKLVFPLPVRRTK